MNQPTPRLNETGYVLITAAFNEEAYIERTILSVIAQTLVPRKWIIVSDGSTDRTDEIINKYAKHHSFIDFVRKEKRSDEPGFASKVYAIRKGLEKVSDEQFDFIGHLDGDISLGNDYYGRIMREFELNSDLGLAGGYIYEERKGVFQSRSLNVPWSVAGAIQIFRRQCYESINGLQPLELGGEDWHAEVKARMSGWEVRAFEHIKAYHHKPSAGERGVVREAFRQGAMDYALGTHPIFELVKSVRRIQQKPYVLFSVIRLTGYFSPYLRKQQRPVSTELIRFLRNEQITRLKLGLFSGRLIESEAGKNEKQV